MGTLQFLRGQILETPPVPITSLTGRTILITGANSGLGLDAAKHLARLNCSHIILACRTIAKGEQAKAEIRAHLQTHKNTLLSPVEISTYVLDLASFSSVLSFASNLRATVTRLDSAILNAGIFLTEFSLSESHETTLTVNVLSTFLLALLLLPHLRASHTAGTPDPVISIVGSAVHVWANTSSLTTPSENAILSTLSDEKKAKMDQRYFLSKLLVMLLVVQLARHLDASAKKPTVVVNNVNPGYCRTPLFRHAETTASKVGLQLIGRSSEEGSRTLVAGVVAGRESQGAYMSEGRVKKASVWVRSEQGEEIGRRVWGEVLTVLEGVRPGIGQEV